jgi:WD40 repeat protein
VASLQSRLVSLIDDDNIPTWLRRSANTDTLVATAGKDHTARLWDGRTGAQLAVLDGHEGEVRGVIFSPDDTKLLTFS